MGVTFGNKHSYNNYHLNYLHKEIPKAEIKRVTGDVPLRHGLVDFTDRLTGGEPIFENRLIEFDFEIRSERSQWMADWSRIAADLHGRAMHVVLDEDPDYFWNGRVDVEGLEDHGSTAGVHISVDAYPFKIQVDSVQKYKITTNVGTRTVNLTNDFAVGFPEFVTAANLEITYNGQVFVATAQNSSPAGLVFKPGAVSLGLRGSSGVTINMRGGML